MKNSLHTEIKQLVDRNNGTHTLTLKRNVPGCLVLESDQQQVTYYKDKIVITKKED